jgi:two-component system cell cycle sensor histidine kinase/response regulator CckA
VAEDDAALRLVTRRVLEKDGHTVLEATNGEEALRIIGEFAGRIDLVVSDMVMPLTSGGALVKALSSTRPDLRVLLVSGYTEEAIHRNGELARRTAFLQKPFTSETLVQKVRETLQL